MSHTDDKKTVLILNYEYPPLGGGAANATYYLIRELAEHQKYNVHLVTSSTDAFEIDNSLPGVTIHKLDIGKKGNIHYQSNKDLLTYAKKAYSYSKTLIAQEDVSAVHAFFGIPCGAVAYLLRKPYIVSLRGSDVPFYNVRFKLLDTFVFQWLSKIIWKKASAVIANSQQLKELALQTAPKQEIGVIYNGVDTAEFSPASERANDEPFTIISTSRLIERKGIHFLIDAVTQLLAEGKQIRMYVIGSGDMAEQLQQTVSEAGATEAIQFVGAIDHSELADWYRKADVFALPSQNEGMSNSLLEAMSSGLGIITTDTGGTRELVSEENGVIMKDNSVETIKAAITALYESAETLQQMKHASRQRAEEFSWKAMHDAYTKQYGETK